MKTLCLVLALLCGLAQAQTATVTATTDRGYQLMRGTSNIGTPKPTEVECKAGIAPDVLTRKATSLYKCRHEQVYEGRYSATVVCAPAPAPTTATMQCPAGTTGSWQQVTTSTRGAAPACTLTTTVAPLEAPAGACTVPPVVSVAYYFSDCQPGASAGCVPGDNANAGTSASAPKQNLTGFNVNTLPAGAAVRFKAGGKWAGNLQVRNLNATPTQPLIFEPYGTGPAPTLGGFDFGMYQDTAMDGGYTLRGLKLDGGNGTGYGVFLHMGTRNVVLDGVEITGFELGIHSQQTTGADNVGLVVRNSNIHHNSGMGMLGDAVDMVLEGNTFASNNFSGSIFNHAIYLSGKGRNGIVRNNTFTGNSAVNGVCQGGNVTVHGQWDGLLIEGNTIAQQASTEGCWGFSITPGYAGSPEWFRNVVVRNNTITNLGGCSVCVTSAPGIVIERNRVFNNQASQLALVVSPPSESTDDAGVGPVLRDNVVCFTQPNANSGPVAVRVAGGSESGTVYRIGADATTGACAP